MKKNREKCTCNHKGQCNVCKVRAIREALRELENRNKKK